MAVVLFLMHLVVYAWFWQWRGWNESSRLIVTYSIVEAGTIAVDRLHTQSSDLCFVNGHYYSYKPPGQSLLGVPVYALFNVCGVSHPVMPDRDFGNEPRDMRTAVAMSRQMRFWWPDYVLTLATSGVLTAALAVMIYAAGLRLGCPQGGAVLVAAAYGLGTPALTHATLYCGHQVAAFAAFAAFLLIWPQKRCQAPLPERPEGCFAQRCLTPFLAGLLAGLAVMAEYPMIFTSVGLTAYAVWAGYRGLPLAAFVFGAAICAAGLAAYHTEAFGGPLETGYRHAVVAEFRETYTAENPRGLVPPTFERAGKILFSGRGLIWYAPIVVLAPLGFVPLARQRQYAVALIAMLAFGSFYLVNAAHPTWEGGASTGPRYLLASVPFLMLPIASLVAEGGRPVRWILCVLGLAGFAVCLACTAIPEGGRLPHMGPGGYEPLQNLVWERISAGQFGRNLGNMVLHGTWEGPRSQNWWCLLPLLDVLVVSGGVLAWRTRTHANPD